MNPPYLFCFVVGLFFGFLCWLLFLLLFCVCFLLEGFKGQVRIPEGPPHLAINPP